jgi:hypothetical protein
MGNTMEICAAAAWFCALGYYPPHQFIALMAVAKPPPITPNIVVQVNEVSWVAVAGLGLSVLLAAAQAFRVILQKTKRRKVTFERVGRIEVIFDSAFGPHLGLHGIVFSENKQSLVTSLRAIVVRTRDNSTRRLDAHLWRDPKITLGATPTVTSELAGAIVVPQDSGFSFYGIFVDLRLWIEEIQQIQKGLRDAWNLVLLENYGKLPIPQTDAEKAQRRAEAEQVYRNFIAKDPTSSAAQLSRLYSWLAGDYTLRIECNVRGDERVFRRTWDFLITVEDEQQLRSNIANIQRVICDVEARWAPYYTAFPQYKEPRLPALLDAMKRGVTTGEQ